MSTMDWALFGGLFLIGAFYTMKLSSRSQTSETYFIADKKTPLFALVATLVMTELNTSTLVGFASMGYSFGPSATLLGFVFLVGLLFYALSVAKKWKQFDGIAVTTFFTERYNQTIGYVASFVLLTAMVGFSANFLKSLTLIFSPLFPGMNPWLLSAIFCALMMGISLRGGLKAIIRVDIISFIITSVLFTALVIISFSHGQSLPATTWTGPTFPPDLAISLTVITMATYILAPWYGQKIFSANSESTAFKAVLISAVIVSLIYVVGIFAASVVASDPSAHISAPHEAIPYVINHYLPFPLQGIAYATLFFIAATTLVGLWNTIASVILGHGHKSLKGKPLSTSVTVTAMIAILSYVGANLFVDQVLGKLILCNIPIAALSFSLLAGFYWRAVTPMASALSIATGTLGGVGCYVYFGDPEYIWYWAMYVIPLHFIVGLTATFISSSGVLKEPQTES